MNVAVCNWTVPEAQITAAAMFNQSKRSKELADFSLIFRYFLVRRPAPEETPKNNSILQNHTNKEGYRHVFRCLNKL